MSSEILYFTNRGVRRRIDELQQEMASIFANTGKDSTRDEIIETYRKEQELMDRIKDFDPNYEKLIRPYGRKKY